MKFNFKSPVFMKHVLILLSVFSLSQARGESGILSSGNSTCPFLQNSGSAQALIESTQAHLTSLKQQNSEQCGAFNTQIEYISKQFESMQRTLSDSTISVNSGQIDCNNYENHFRREYELALSIQSGLATSFEDNSFVEACKEKSDLSFEDCAQEFYAKALGDKSRTCQNQNQSNLNQDTRANLENLTNTLESLIRNGNSGCGSVSTSVIAQSALQQTTAALALSQGAGLPALGISIVGRLLSALAGKLFENPDSAQNLLTALDNDQNRPDIQCLYFNLQQSVLGCDTRQNPSSVFSINQPSTPVCIQSVNQLESLSTFSRQLSRTLTQIQTAEAERGNQTDDSDKPSKALTDAGQAGFDQFYELLYDPVNNAPRKMPDGQTVEQFYNDVAASMLKSKSLTDRPQGLALQRILNEFNTLNSSTVAPKDVAKRTHELSMQLAGLSGEPALNLPSLIERYMRNRSATDKNFANALNMSRIQRQTQAATGRTATAEMSQSQSEQDRSRLATALYAMVNERKTRNQFVGRLEQLERDWQRVQTSSNTDTKMSVLNEMFGLCMTTQGMAYFSADNKSRATVATFTNTTPRRDAQPYSAVCSKFNCTPDSEDSNQSLLIPFNPSSSRYGSGTVSDKFGIYQCAISRSYASRLQRLRQNISNSGAAATNQICGR